MSSDVVKNLHMLQRPFSRFNVQQFFSLPSFDAFSENHQKSIKVQRLSGSMHNLTRKKALSKSLSKSQEELSPRQMNIRLFTKKRCLAPTRTDASSRGFEKKV
jgi:hypothetical protein